MTSSARVARSSMTTRMPSRFDSSRRSEMPSILPLAHEVGDALEQQRLVHLVGDLGDDDAAAALVSSNSAARAGEVARGPVA